ncbi:MAG TPA: outer membrane protein transport protein [Burkholderiales bacterium]|nr:outer membrane protein transport protein [Burkholderiales bacterium]
MKRCTEFVRAIVAGTLAATAGAAMGGGFAIGTQSGSGTGNAFAGGAAAVDDASIAWYNPAGMTYLPRGKQVTGALHAVKPSFEFQNSGSTPPVFGAAGTGDGGDAGDWAFIPNAYFTMDINPKWSFGLAVNAPFGLKTEYDAGWRGQVVGLESDVKSVNINPSVAYKVSDTVSVGAGVSVQKFDAKLTSCSFPPAAPACPNLITLDADDIGYGFNLGLMVQAAPTTRIGVSYRSSIKFELEGTATFSAAPAINSDIKADLRVPDSVSFSLFHQAGPNWELMGDITWTKWSTVQQLMVVRTTNTAAPAIPSLPFQWDDTFRYGIGANYKMNAQTKLRFGVAYDETPTNDQTRTPRLPDQDRTWVAFGVQYKPSKAGTLEVGYAHEFIRDANVNVPPPGGATPCTGTCLRGSYDNKVDILSVQYSHQF